MDDQLTPGEVAIYNLYAQVSQVDTQEQGEEILTWLREATEGTTPSDYVGCCLCIIRA